jgi:uncharacterized protein YoxC
VEEGEMNSKGGRMKKLVLLAILLASFAQAQELTPLQRIENIKASIQSMGGQLQFIDNQMAELLTKRQKLNQQIGINLKAKADLEDEDPIEK